MAIWVLIVFFRSVITGGAAATTVSFHSREACEKAMYAVTRDKTNVAYCIDDSTGTLCGATYERQ